jgi:metal-responsive CopG/Arc/MetJ family transcriptional regulator
MPTKAVKLAISMPLEEYREVEKSRKQLGISRSNVITQALRYWIAQLHERDRIRSYVQGYKQFPETVSEERLLGELSSTVLAHEEWEE